MTIYMDQPRVWSTRFGASSHLVSDLPGAVGHKELVRFAVRLGLQLSWLQNAHTPNEHFDLMKSKINKARQLGAVEVTFLQLGRIIGAKRDAHVKATEAYREAQSGTEASKRQSQEDQNRDSDNARSFKGASPYVKED